MWKQGKRTGTLYLIGLRSHQFKSFCNSSMVPSLITSIDLSSAFLQIGLKRESRKYTPFCLTLSYINSQDFHMVLKTLSLFLWQQCSWHSSPTHDYALACVDDIIVHSTTFELHLKHLDTAMSRLTRAGYTVKEGKCTFCNIEISFLGHVIRQGVVSPDPRRIEAILTHCERVTQICVFNTVKLGTSASSP